MRNVKYQVAMSLDGYIAGPAGEIDWIVPDPSVDFRAVYAEFDTVLLGRHTYELTRQPGAPQWPSDWRVYVFSRTMTQREHPAVIVVGADDAGVTVADLRAQSGRDIWLFGGAALFSSLLALDLVDVIGVAIMPVILGRGRSFSADAALRSRLRLTRSETSRAGIVNLAYGVERTVGSRR